MKNLLKRLLLLFLAVGMILSSAACDSKDTDSADNSSQAGSSETDVVSRLVTTEDGNTYIEHNGEPYLFYGTQLRIDNIRERYDADVTLIDTMISKVKEDGFKTVVIPVKWYQIEPEKDQFDFALMDLYYAAVYKYDLTVQWLWFGTNVCGSGGCTPKYMKNAEEYPRISPPEGESGIYFDFTSKVTLEREKYALGKFMEYIAERDTERRCVMIQVDNEISHGGPVFDGGTDTWYKTEEAYSKFGWAGGQHYAIAEYLNKLGDVIHNSDYNCVTRVNIMNDAWTVGKDITDVLLNGTGIDIIGIDVYETTWYDNENNIFSNEGNLFHFAEASTAYDHSYTVVKFMAEGYGFLSYCYNDYGAGDGGYYNIKDGNLFNINEKTDNSIAAVRKFNYMIDKCDRELAYAISQGCVAAFNYQQKENDVKVTRVFGDLNVTFEAPEKGYGMAFWLSEKEFVVMASEDKSEFAFGTAKVEKAEYGAFENGEWVSEKDGPTIKGNRTVIDGYRIVKVTVR